MYFHPEESLLQLSPSGPYCPQGGFHVDPHNINSYSPPEIAIITHGHSDHARTGSKLYICTDASAPILRQRLGADIALKTLAYGEILQLGDANVSLHPAGHILGSAQVRIEAQGQVWVLSGDYKRTPDISCEPFEVVPCDVFVTEATFALPIYAWEPTERVVAEILRWWDRNAAAGRASLLYAYALGKAQRILAELARQCDRPVYLHGAVAPYCDFYRERGVRLPETPLVREGARGSDFSRELIIAPPSAHQTPWERKFKDWDSAFASGWMQVRGIKRRRFLDRGFVLSDHASWNELIDTVIATGATRVITTHGSADILAKHLRELGIESDTPRCLPRGQGLNADAPAFERGEED